MLRYLPLEPHVPNGQDWFFSPVSPILICTTFSIKWWYKGVWIGHASFKECYRVDSWGYFCLWQILFLPWFEKEVKGFHFWHCRGTWILVHLSSRPFFQRCQEEYSFVERQTYCCCAALEMGQSRHVFCNLVGMSHFCLNSYLTLSRLFCSTSHCSSVIIRK